MFVYKITNLVNQNAYIGITSVSIAERWQKHVAVSKQNISRALSKAIQKYGTEAFSIEAIEEVSSLSEAKDREIYYINYYDTFKGLGYNMTKGGDYIWHDQSPEFKDYHRARVKEGMANRSDGAKEQFAQKISDTWQNMAPEEKADRIAKRIKGNQKFWKNLTPEERSRIANPNPRTKTYKVTNPEGDVILITNLAKFCRENGLSAPGLNACASGRYKSYNGWKCERVVDD